MAHSLAPTPLGLKRRIELLVARLIMALFVLRDRLRPSPWSSNEVSHHRYGDDPAETLQYIPRKAGSPERAPIVFIHGGGWIIGKKELYARDLLVFAGAGHPVFNLEYPVAPENPHPGILLSLLDALRWVRREHRGVDAVHLMGDSAGGNLAMMLGILCSNPHLITDLNGEPTPEAPLRCRSVVSLYGILDRLSWLRTGFPGANLMLECYAGRAAFEEQVGPRPRHHTPGPRLRRPPAELPHRRRKGPALRVPRDSARNGSQPAPAPFRARSTRARSTGSST